MRHFKSLCALLILAFVCSLAASGADEIPVLLPDGTPFESWEKPQAFSKTYHVNQNHPRASDSNKGTERRPWKTIGRAAQMLQPGERVVVHGGVYREWVKPERGGTSPEAMISYEAAPGEQVILTGSDSWKPEWRPSNEYKLKDITIWQAELTGAQFEGANPFCLQNFTIQKDSDTWKDFPSFELRRGQLFVDGVYMPQVSLFDELGKAAGCFWVSENGMSIFLRMPNDASPQGHTFEVTTREQVFAPTTPYLNYIRISGFTMMRAGNGVPIPPPQRGLLSAARGHHWIIEDCEIAYANTLGMDLGGQWWSYGTGEAQGFHIVRRNYVHHCGVSSMSAWHNMANQHMLIEDNLITDNCWMPIGSHYESAGVKFHSTEDCLIRRNIILRTANGPALWLDGEVRNTRITQNLFANSADTVGLGAVCLEINHGPNLFDNNIIVGSNVHGFHEHDVDRAVVMQNLIANGQGFGVHLRPGDPARVNPPLENNHRVFGNIVAGFPECVFIPNDTTRSDFNLFGEQDFSKAFARGDKEPPMPLEGWRALGQDKNSSIMPLEVHFDEPKMTLSIRGKAEQLPEFDTFPDLLPEVAKARDLLKQDYFGTSRPDTRFAVGPFANTQLDGSPVCVDVRKNSRFAVNASK
ncbi:MAG: right-handed parallel beta-helix repeat-containing protein [Candidatus Hydrogenedentes bacterium]|nr:right-handed parallel beta-helix repeat-containing protein [Candidatus Hydrogenedentota bacterium]